MINASAPGVSRLENMLFNSFRISVLILSFSAFDPSLIMVQVASFLICFLIKLIALLGSGTLGGHARVNFVSDFVIFWACMDNNFACMIRSLLCGVLSIAFSNIFILGS